MPFKGRHIADNTIEPVKASSRIRRYAFDNFQTQPICTASTGHGDPTGTTGDTNLMVTGSYPQPITWSYFIMGAGQTIVAPVHAATTGLGVELDKTDDEGAEYVPGGTTNLGRFAFVVGTDESFFVRLKFTLSDVSGTDLCVLGWRKTEAFQAALTSYTDYAMIGLVTTAGDIKITTRLNSGTAATVDTTANWADTETHTLGVEVRQSGEAIFTIDGAFPSVTKIFTFDAGDTVIPSFKYLHATTSPQDVDWLEFECGLRPRRAV